MLFSVLFAIELDVVEDDTFFVFLLSEGTTRRSPLILEVEKLTKGNPVLCKALFPGYVLEEIELVHFKNDGSHYSSEQRYQLWAPSPGLRMQTESF